TREQAYVFAVVFRLFVPSQLNVFLITLGIKHLALFGSGRLRQEMGTKQNWLRTVLIATKVVNEVHGVVDVVHVDCRICIGTLERSDVGRIAQEHESKTPKSQTQE